MRFKLLNQKPPQDVLNILKATAILDITEFQFFKLAYREWFGIEPAFLSFQATFAQYMLQGAVPYWVRSYTRQILALNDQQSRQYSDSEVQDSPSDSDASDDIQILATVVFLILGLIFTAQYAGHVSSIIQGCYFAPCF